MSAPRPSTVVADDPLEAVEDGLRAACAGAGPARPLGGLDLYRVPAEHPFLRTVALARGAPADPGPAIAALLAAAPAAGRRPPPVELVAERRPGLRAALAAAGFARALSAPLLVGPPRPAAAAAGACRPLAPDAPEALLDATLEQQHRILGERPPSPAERAAWRRALAAGTVRTWVRVQGGRPVAAASLLAAAPVAELAGLWTVPEERRRGHALAVAAAALDGHARAGGRLAWAAAEVPASARLLEALGLRRVGTLERWEPPG